ncbi:MAG: hypothetical protein JW873_01280 [Candidatus Saganbacteria bacterium]|nr:hypothetical protein [Candidatus Saganbacteria bacterium]
MSFANNNVGAELNNQGKLYALVKPQPAQAQAVAEHAVQAKDQKSSGLSWTQKGNETVVATQEETDLLSLSSSSVSLTTAAKPAQTVDPAASLRAGLDNFLQALIGSIYENIEGSIRKKYSHDAMQARFGASSLDGLMSKLFLRLGPSLLDSLGETGAAEKIAAIRERVTTQLKKENNDKMVSCVESEIRLRTYGQA